ncbi:zinc-binding phosphatase, putative [Bodo saltans]|uniref:Zinc-binding phosphatase, putative n=1 Tax=Bodo saltans TaxID=75058 RepID=A0A0S4JDP3_BODSA|nr:zinc-binding phosphatase, putative [Bodo saltans]|eukprot:CUG88153.1 zinc-binding phosphatase, putative [Bodo saltans]
MLPGEQTSYVSSLGTLFLVPMTDGGAKPLPKSIRKPQHPDVLQAATRNAAAHPCSNLFNSDLLREQSISPIQCTSTNFRLFVKPVSTRGSTGADSVRLCREIAIPYMLVDRYEIEIRAPKIFALAVYTKWTWVLRIQSVTEEPIQSLASILQHNFPQAVQQFFAFTYFRALVDELHSPYGVNGAGGHQPLVGLRKESGMEFEAPSGELLQRSQTIVMQLSSSSDPVPPSLRDGDGVYDTAWGAFNIERELHRQTVLNGTPFDKDDIPMNLPPAGYTALNQFGCGKNLLPWFHIVKLARIDIFYTYPTTVIMPRKVSEELLNKCAAYRHAGRVPVVTWIHGVNGATLSRSAQPKAGSRKPAKDDQTLCSYLNQSYHHTNAAPSTSHHDPTADGRGGVGGSASNRTRTVSPPPPPFLRSGTADGYPVGLSKKPPSLFETSSSDLLDEADIALAIPTATTPTLQPTASAHTTTASETTTTANKSEMRPLHIIDCRSRTAATANLATGGGFENARNYDRACIDFMGLDNIHVVRDSFDKLRKLCVSMQQPQLDAPTTRTAYGSFHSRLESTGWVELQERLIWASWKTATLLAGGASVLVHCTDGMAGDGAQVR